MTKNATAAAIEALYAWYSEAGVDLDVAENAIGWRGLGPSEEAAPADGRSPAERAGRVVPAGKPTGAPDELPRIGARSPAQPPQSAAPEAALMSAREAAGAARDLDELERHLAAFDGCRLKVTAKSLCFYRGSPQARLMVIGEAPGREEDLQGKPFVGPAGRLLDKMLAAIGLGEGDVHITNIVYWRPPGNRNPTPQEAQICLPFLARQIELVAPEILLILGSPAAKQIMATNDGIMKLRGKWRSYEAAGRRLRAMATLHPAYLLRTPAAKRMAWRDLLMVEDALVELDEG